MRALVVTFASLVGLAACSPYSPSLPAQPFYCGDTDPKCPDGYTCSGMDSMGHMLCTSGSTTGIDAPIGNSMCANDTAVEGTNKNDTTATAYAIPSPLPNNPFVMTGLAICPMGDKDNYAVTVPSTEMLEVDLTYETWGSGLVGSILASNGTPIINLSMVSGETDTLRGTIAGAAAGVYYVQIAGPTTAPGINNYKLSIKLGP